MTNMSHNASSEGGDIPIPTGPQGPVAAFPFAKSARMVPSVMRFVRPRVYIGLVAMGALIAPTFLYTPAYAWAIERNPLVTTTEVSIPSDWDTSLVNITTNEVARHRITNDAWVERVDTYIDMVAQIESEMDAGAYNPSGAMSYFQFKSESIKTAHNRLINYYKRHNLGEIPRFSVALYYNPQSVYETSYNRQAVLMVINIIEQDRERGTDYFRQFLAGDDEAGIDAYYRYHHTNPDQFTINRTERLYEEYFGDDSQLLAQR
jgi:hypothetical protein